MKKLVLLGLLLLGTFSNAAFASPPPWSFTDLVPLGCGYPNQVTRVCLVRAQNYAGTVTMTQGFFISIETQGKAPVLRAVSGENVVFKQGGRVHYNYSPELVPVGNGQYGLKYLSLAIHYRNGAVYPSFAQLIYGHNIPAVPGGEGFAYGLK